MQQYQQPQQQPQPQPQPPQESEVDATVMQHHIMETQQLRLLRQLHKQQRMQEQMQAIIKQTPMPVMPRGKKKRKKKTGGRGGKTGAETGAMKEKEGGEVVVGQGKHVPLGYKRGGMGGSGPRVEEGPVPSTVGAGIGVEGEGGVSSMAESACVVCMDEGNTHMFIPCRHKCVCERCADLIMRGAAECPRCRVTAVRATAALEDELARLREENERLRVENGVAVKAAAGAGGGGVG